MAKDDDGKRTRNTGEVRVLTGASTEDGGLMLLPDRHEDADAAWRWVKEEGQDGERYAVVRLLGWSKVEVQRVVRLVPVGPQAAAEPDDEPLPIAEG